MSEEARRTLRYVEPLNDARTPLAGFINSLPEDFYAIMAISAKASEATLHLHDPSGFIGVADAWQDRPCQCMLISSFPTIDDSALDAAVLF